MGNDRLPRACYNMLVELDRAGRITWATHVRNMLNLYGFSYVWLQQNNLNVQLFYEEFKLRARDCAIQEWHAELESNRRLVTYKLFKRHFEPEYYIDKVVGRCFISALARLRCSNHSLEIELGRRNGVEYENRLCKLCFGRGSQYVENEYHFLLVCPSLSDLREHFLPQLYHDRPYIELLPILMSSDDSRVLNDLARFIHFGMKKRQELLSLIT